MFYAYCAKIMYYKWRDAFLEGGAQVFEDQRGGQLCGYSLLGRSLD